MTSQAAQAAPYERLKAAGAFLPAGASALAIAVVGDDLETAGRRRLPADYEAFLSLADGAQSAAFLLYGTKPQALAGGQTEPDIFEATRRLAERVDIGAGVVLGRASGNLTVIFSDAGSYVVLDMTGEALFEFGSFAAFVSDWLDRKKL